MEIPFDIGETILIAIIVFFIGYALNTKIGFLRKYNIPIPAIGGLLGGPVGYAQIAKSGPRGTGVQVMDEGKVDNERSHIIATQSFLATVSIILICTTGGAAVAAAVAGTKLSLPVFVWCLFVGIVVANELIRDGGA